VSGLTVAKLAVNIVSSLGVSKILGDVIKNNTNVVTTVDKVLVNAGTLVLGTMVVEKASDHVNTTMDNVINKIKSRKDGKESKDEEKPVVDEKPIVEQ
jgi:hypothetical protein